MRVAITTGDPAGIGPEISLRALLQPSSVAAKGATVALIGHLPTLERCARQLGLEVFFEAVDGESWSGATLAAGAAGRISVVDTPTPGIDTVRPGEVSAAGGRGAHAYVMRACAMAEAGLIDAIVTAPIHKEALRAAGVSQVGHTEILAEAFGAPAPLTLFVTGRLRIFFYTRHLSLRQAVDAVQVAPLLRFIHAVDQALRQRGLAAPRLGMAALNPHASDGGLFGREEGEVIIPAVQAAQAAGVDVSEPIGADSVFHMAKEGRFDAVLSLYHDQGHIAAKTLDFHGTITATLGLPVLRTSVDHGTAMDIAWRGVANAQGMRAAIDAAVNGLLLG